MARSASLLGEQMQSQQLSFVEEQHLPPTISICIPPILEGEVIAKAQEDPPLHPAWSKAHRRGRHFVITTNSLEDVSELADFARVELEEPEAPLSKARRQACQALLDRAHRHVVLMPLGTCHCIAVEWRDRPLRSHKASQRASRALRESNRGLTPRYW